MQNCIGGGASLLRTAADQDDISADFFSASRSLLDIARDFIRRGTLLFDRGGDGGGNLVDIINGLADTLNDINGRRRRSLNGADLTGDLFRGLTGLGCQVLDLGGDNGKALARLPRPAPLRA